MTLTHARSDRSGHCHPPRPNLCRSPWRRLQLAHFLNSDTSLWAEAFWAANAETLPTAYLEQRGLHSESSEMRSGAQSPHRKQPRLDHAAGADAADAAWAALLSEGSELADAVLRMHPAVTAVFDDYEAMRVEHGTPREVSLLRLPAPLRLPGLRRLCRSQPSLESLTFPVGESGSERLAQVLRGLAEATSVALCFDCIATFKRAPGQEDPALTTIVRSVGPLLSALQPLCRLQRLSLSGGGWDTEKTPVSCMHIDLSPLSALTQLSQLEMRGALAAHPSARIVAQLAHLQVLHLDNYAWPLGIEQPQQSSQAACSTGDVPHDSVDAAMHRPSEPDCTFPSLRIFSLSIPHVYQQPRQLPTAPRLESLTVGRADECYDECWPFLDECGMRNICSCIATANQTLESVALSMADAEATALLITALPQARQLRKLQVTVLEPADAQGFAAVMAAVTASTRLTYLNIRSAKCHALRDHDRMLRFSAVISSIAALSCLRALHVGLGTTPLDHTATHGLELLMRAATRLSALVDLAFEANDDEVKCSAMTGSQVHINVHIANFTAVDVDWDHPEDGVVQFCTSLLPPLAEWATANSKDADTFTLSAPFWVAPAMAGALSKLAAMQSLKSACLVLSVARHSEVLNLANACCNLTRLTRLICMAEVLLDAAGSALPPPPEVSVQLSVLTGLQQLTFGGVRCRPQFEESLQSALNALPSLQILNLRDIQCWQGRAADLQGVYAHLPTTLTCLRLATISIRNLSAGLYHLTQLKELELNNCLATDSYDGSFELQPQRLPQLTKVKVTSDDESVYWW